MKARLVNCVQGKQQGIPAASTSSGLFLWFQLQPGHPKKTWICLRSLEKVLKKKYLSKAQGLKNHQKSKPRKSSAAEKSKEYLALLLDLIHWKKGLQGWRRDDIDVVPQFWGFYSGFIGFYSGFTRVLSYNNQKKVNLLGFSLF